MQPVEAITRLIALADGMTAPPDGPTRNVLHTEEEQQQNELAINVVQAMLNTALPVARFRCFVKIDSGSEEGLEFTVCAVKIEEIACALRPLTKATRKVYVNLWEQRATGADMLAGYQGWTRNIGRRSSHNALGRYLDELVAKYSANAS